MSVSYSLKELLVEPFNSISNNKNMNMSDELVSLKLIHNRWRHRGQNYSVIKYDKEYMGCDSVNTTGLLRSLICKDDKIMSFSPPKSQQYALFKKIYPIQECYGEEFVEGTMINLFFDKDLEEDGDWEITTKSNIGARICFFKTGAYEYEKSFRYMFLDVCQSVGLDFDTLPKEYCYSFVFQHPNNRIVIPFTEKKLYLIKVYQIDNSQHNVTEIPRENIVAYLKNTTVCFPENIPLISYQALETEINDLSDYKNVGTMIYHAKSGVRTKYRNPAYEEIRLLRGNQPKLQYRYLELRKINKLNEYLKYFPEARFECAKYREQLYSYTRNLHSNYVRCYVKKEKPLKQFPHQYRIHMFGLHQIYLENTNNIINFNRVKAYINDISVPTLMYSLNYNLRKQTEETNAADADK